MISQHGASPVVNQREDMIIKMLNPFTTAPKFLAGYFAARKYSADNGEIVERLHKEGKYDEEREIIRKGQKLFCETVADKLKIDFELSGTENIPADGPFMVYSNHQGFADIPALCYAFRDHCQMGFVAKEEWRKYKILRDAILYTRSIFLDRGNPRAAVKAVSEVKDLLDKGFNMTIFPEGTRSKCHEMGEFKAGAFKFAEKGKVPVLPVTIDGSYKLFEEKGSYQPCHIKITIHPLVHIEQMDKHQQKEAAEQIEQTIRSAL